ncbi:MAG: leucine-rich repeat domain-containing protein [Bacteroidota bacterium]
MFKNITLIGAFLLTTISSFSQKLDSARLQFAYEYTSIEEAIKEPEKVIKLSLRKSKLTILPKEIFLFKNIQELDLSKNRLTTIPDSIVTLKNLERLDLSKNNFIAFPKAICKLKHLKHLIIFENKIVEIPKEIEGMETLVFLDMWGNELSVFPKEMGKLKNLRYLDLRVINLYDSEKEELELLMPNVKILFSQGCNCGK